MSLRLWIYQELGLSMFGLNGTHLQLKFKASQHYSFSLFQMKDWNTSGIAARKRLWATPASTPTSPCQRCLQKSVSPSVTQMGVTHLLKYQPVPASPCRPLLRLSLRRRTADGFSLQMRFDLLMRFVCRHQNTSSRVLHVFCVRRKRFLYIQVPPA